MDFKIQNIVGSCDVRFPIRLEGLLLQHNQFCRLVLPFLYKLFVSFLIVPLLACPSRSDRFCENYLMVTSEAAPIFWLPLLLPFNFYLVVLLQEDVVSVLIITVLFSPILEAQNYVIM